MFTFFKQLSILLSVAAEAVDQWIEEDFEQLESLRNRLEAKLKVIMAYSNVGLIKISFFLKIIFMIKIPLNDDWVHLKCQLAPTKDAI